MSTLVSIVLPVLTSKSSGARYGIVECSPAVSWTRRARDRDVIGVGDGAREPRSISIGSPRSSSIMLAGLMSRWEYERGEPVEWPVWGPRTELVFESSRNGCSCSVSRSSW